MKTYIPTKKITLPDSKITLELYSFLSGGEERDIQKLLMASGAMQEIANAGEKIKKDSEPGKLLENIDNKTFLTIYDMQDLAISFAFIAAYAESGEKIVVDDLKLFVRDLPTKDSDVLYNTIQDIINDSSMKKEEKKS